MNPINFRNICISSVVGLLTAIALLSYGNAIGAVDVSLLMLFYLGVGSAMIMIAMERDYEISIEDRILGIEASRSKENKNIYDLESINSKKFYFLFIAVIVLSWLGVYSSGAPVWVVVNLIIILAFAVMIGGALAISIKCMSGMGKIDLNNAIYATWMFSMPVGAGIFYAILFTDHIEVVLQTLPIFAISAGIFTAIELVILNGLHKISIWKNMLGLSAHLIFPAGVMFVLVMDYEFSNNLNSVSWKFWMENYADVAKIYLGYLIPGLLVGFLCALSINKFRRD